MTSFFRSLWSARNLLVNLVRRDLTVRYKSTVLGFFWSFAKPLAYMLIYHLVFGVIIGLKIKQGEIPYALHVLAGVLPWTFFLAATNEAMNSILASANLVKKVKLPVAVFPVAAVGSQAVHFAMALFVVVGMMLILGLVPGPLFLLVPAIFGLQIILTMGVALILAGLNVFYRDVSSLWEVAAAAWFYATPIIYPAYIATEYFDGRGWTWAKWIYLANPMSPIVMGYRRLMLYGSVESSAKSLALEVTDPELLISLGVACVVSFALLALAQRLFARLSGRFADVL